MTAQLLDNSVIESQDSTSYRDGTLRYQEDDGTYTVIEIGSRLYSILCCLATEVYDDELQQWKPIYTDTDEDKGE